MADLESAADAALAKAKQFTERTEEAEQVLRDLEAAVSRVAAQLDSDWDAVRQDARSLIEALEEESGRLGEQGDEAGKAVAGLKEALAAAHSEQVAGAAAARGEIASLDADLDEARAELGQGMAALEETVRTLTERAADLQERLQGALADARDFLSVQVDALDLVEANITERAADLAQDMANDCQAALQDKYENWATTLNEVEDVVEQAFADAREHVEQVVEYALAECARAHLEAVEELQDLVGGLERAAETLSRAIASEQAELDAGTDRLGHAFQDTDERLRAMTAALDGIKELMASFSFVQM